MNEHKIMDNNVCLIIFVHDSLPHMHTLPYIYIYIYIYIYNMISITHGFTKRNVYDYT